MHLRVCASVHLADSFLAADVEEQDLLVRTHTDSKGTVLCHLNAMNVTTVAAKISDVDSCFTVPDLHILVDLTT